MDTKGNSAFTKSQAHLKEIFCLELTDSSLIVKVKFKQDYFLIYMP